MKNNMTTVISGTSNDKDDKKDDKVIIFRRMKRDRYGYPSKKYEDVYYKRVVDVDGKEMFERVYLKNNNNNKTKTNY